MNRLGSGLSGLLAAGLALTTTELVAAALGGNSPFIAVGDAVIGLTPGPVVRFAISTFGSNNRLVLLTSMVVVMALAAVLIGIAAVRRRKVGIGGFVTFAVLGAVAGVTDPLMSPVTAVVAPAVGAAAGIGALLLLLRTLPEGEAQDEAVTADPRNPPASRRAFLQLGTTVAGTAVAFGFLGRALQGGTSGGAPVTDLALPRPATSPTALPPGTSFNIPGLSPLITPNDEFFRIDTALTVPRIDGARHRVRIGGMVEQPFELSYAELLDLADTEAVVTLSCVSNEVGGDLVGNARWFGVPLADLLQRAGVQPEADQVVGRSVDGWTSGFPVEAALDGRDALVAVGMNGEPLPAKHGFPVRLVIPGLYGYVANTKWLSEIELTTFARFRYSPNASAIWSGRVVGRSTLQLSVGTCQSDLCDLPWHRQLARGQHPSQERPSA
jgi:DMSO/TMAO reductase YedYZ molybdopterin-dependent catalytic subunit